jgi:hypothetical protein
MAKQGSSTSGLKTSVARSDQNAAGVSAVLKSCDSHRSCIREHLGDPDTLFVPLARSGTQCKQNAGQADRAWGGARKCSNAERNATSVFLAAGQQFLTGIDRLIAREHLHSRPKLRNLAHADAALRGNERTHLVLQSGDSREDFWRDFCGTESCPRNDDYAG